MSRVTTVRSSRPDSAGRRDEVRRSDSAGAPVAAFTVSVPEAATMLGISRTLAYECVRSGELRALRLGNRLVVPVHVIEQMLESVRR